MILAHHAWAKMIHGVPEDERLCSSKSSSAPSPLTAEREKALGASPAHSSGRLIEPASGGEQAKSIPSDPQLTHMTAGEEELCLAAWWAPLWPAQSAGGAAKISFFERITCSLTSMISIS